MPKNAHTGMVNKKDRPTDPPKFQAKRANKPFIFLGHWLNWQVFEVVFKQYDKRYS